MRKDAVLQCILDSLSIFGDNSKAAILARLRDEGVESSSDRFDTDVFCGVMQELLGPASDFVIKGAAERFFIISGISLADLGVSDRAFYQHHQGTLESLFKICEMVSQSERDD
jgi:hypothetical protein